MKIFSTNFSKKISLFVLLTFALNILCEIGVVGRIDKDNHSISSLSSQVSVDSNLSTDSSDQDQGQNCTDPCHVGNCHFGHCTHIIMSENSYEHSAIPAAHLFVNDSAPSAPNLKSLRRPPRLS